MTVIKQKSIKDSSRVSSVFEMTYSCNWCGHVFSRKVGVYGGGEGHHSNMSDQVTCPMCDNGIKTFDEK